MLLKYFVTVKSSACTLLAFKVDPRFTLWRRKQAELGEIIAVWCRAVSWSKGPLRRIVTRHQKQVNRRECCMHRAWKTLLCYRCSESEAGQSASFCHACYFLCDWLCVRQRKTEAMIRQRSHVIARRSEHKVYSPQFSQPAVMCIAFHSFIRRRKRLACWISVRCLVCVLLFETFVAADTDMKERCSLWEMWADLHKKLALLSFLSFSTAPFLFYVLLCIHLHSMIITVIYTGLASLGDYPHFPSHCCTSERTSLPAWHLCFQ